MNTDKPTYILCCSYVFFSVYWSIYFTCYVIISLFMQEQKFKIYIRGMYHTSSTSSMKITWVCVRTWVEAALLIPPEVNFRAYTVTFFIYFRSWCSWLSTVIFVFPGIIKTCRLSEECKNICCTLENYNGQNHVTKVFLLKELKHEFLSKSNNFLSYQTSWF